MEWSLILVVVLFAIIFIGIYLMIRLSNKNRKLKDKLIITERCLNIKTKETISLSLKYLKSTELIKTITNSIRSSLYDFNPKNRKILEILLKETEVNLAEKTWEEFDRAFKEIHIDFNKKLLAKFPDLTLRELRLCAFTRLNLNTKEISSITNQSSNSVDTARFRLKQKLGIPKKENISVFLTQF